MSDAGQGGGASPAGGGDVERPPDQDAHAKGAAAFGRELGERARRPQEKQHPDNCVVIAQDLPCSTVEEVLNAITEHASGAIPQRVLTRATCFVLVYETNAKRNNALEILTAPDSGLSGTFRLPFKSRYAQLPRGACIVYGHFNPVALCKLDDNNSNKHPDQYELPELASLAKKSLEGSLIGGSPVRMLNTRGSAHITLSSDTIANLKHTDAQKRLDEQKRELEAERRKLDEQRAALDTLQAVLDERQVALDERKTALDERHATLTKSQATLREHRKAADSHRKYLGANIAEMHERTEALHDFMAAFDKTLDGLLDTLWDGAQAPELECWAQGYRAALNTFLIEMRSRHNNVLDRLEASAAALDRMGCGLPEEGHQPQQQGDKSASHEPENEQNQPDEPPPKDKDDEGRVQPRGPGGGDHA